MRILRSEQLIKPLHSLSSCFLFQLFYCYFIFTNMDEKKNVGGKGTQFHYAMTWSGNVYAFKFKVTRALVQLNIFTILKSR